MVTVLIMQNTPCCYSKQVSLAPNLLPSLRNKIPKINWIQPLYKVFRSLLPSRHHPHPAQVAALLTTKKYSPSVVFLGNTNSLAYTISRCSLKISSTGSHPTSYSSSVFWCLTSLRIYQNTVFPKSLIIIVL